MMVSHPSYKEQKQHKEDEDEIDETDYHLRHTTQLAAKLQAREDLLRDTMNTTMAKFTVNKIESRIVRFDSDGDDEEEEMDGILSVGSTVAFRVNLDFPICAPPKPLPPPKAPKILRVTSTSVTLEWTDAQMSEASAPVLKYEVSFRGMSCFLFCFYLS